MPIEKYLSPDLLEKFEFRNYNHAMETYHAEIWSQHDLDGEINLPAGFPQKRRVPYSGGRYQEEVHHRLGGRVYR